METSIAPLTPEQWSEIESKLGKLHALKEGAGATPGEITNATEAIQRLLFKYNLSLADFDFNKAPQSKSLKDRYKEQKMTMGAKIFLEWRQQLMFILCDNYFCRPFMWKGSPACTIIGKPENIQVIWQLYEFIVYQVRRLCNDGWKSYGLFTGATEKVWRNGFYFGAIDQVADRLEAIKQNLRSELPSSSTALVVQLDKELEDAVYEYKPHLKKQKEAAEARAANGEKPPKGGRKSRPIKISSSAYSHGTVAGKSVDIHPAINK